jgi:hypothetical protein
MHETRAWSNVVGGLAAKDKEHSEGLHCRRASNATVLEVNAPRSVPFRLPVLHMDRCLHSLVTLLPAMLTMRASALLAATLPPAIHVCRCLRALAVSSVCRAHGPLHPHSCVLFSCHCRVCRLSRFGDHLSRIAVLAIDRQHPHRGGYFDTVSRVCR